MYIYNRQYTKDIMIIRQQKEKEEDTAVILEKFIW